MAEELLLRASGIGALLTESRGTSITENQLTTLNDFEQRIRDGAKPLTEKQREFYLELKTKRDALPQLSDTAKRFLESTWLMNKKGFYEELKNKEVLKGLYSEDDGFDKAVDYMLPYLNVKGRASLIKSNLRQLLVCLAGAYKKSNSLYIGYPCKEPAWKRTTELSPDVSFKMVDIIKDLVRQGFVENVKGRQHYRIGNNWTGMRSRMRAAQRLVDECFEPFNLIEPDNIGCHPNRPYLILRNKNKEGVAFTGTPETEAMEGVLKGYRDYMKSHVISSSNESNKCPTQSNEIHATQTPWGIPAILGLLLGGAIGYGASHLKTASSKPRIPSQVIKHLLKRAILTSMFGITFSFIGYAIQPNDYGSMPYLNYFYNYGGDSWLLGGLTVGILYSLIHGQDRNNP